VESIRRSVPQAKVDFSNAPQQDLEAFLRRINRNTVAAARALIRQYDFSSIKTLADVGCGGAGLALTMIKELPHVKATAIDLSLVAPIAQNIVAEEGATDRVQVLAADLLSGPLPGSYDTVIGAPAVKNIAPAVNPEGTLFIVAQILDDSRISPLEALGYNLIFINTFDAGESYTEQEHRAWLQ
jgi:16S rRNA G1207 methylase RsmC